MKIVFLWLTDNQKELVLGKSVFQLTKFKVFISFFSKNLKRWRWVSRFSN